MSVYTKYDKTTGKITGILILSKPENLALNIGEGEAAIEGEYSMKTQMVVDGVVVDRPAAELEAERLEAAWNNLRAMRNRLLSSCDWTQVPDAPVDQAAWAAYRQALRDMPSNTVDPENPNWPLPPGN